MQPRREDNLFAGLQVRIGRSSSKDLGAPEMARRDSAMLSLNCRAVPEAYAASRCRLAVEGQALLAGRDRDRLAVVDLAGEDQLGERVLHRLLDHALQRARAVGRILALLGEPVARLGVELERDLAILEQLREPPHLDVDDAAHLLRLQPMEQDDLVDAVEELRTERRAHDAIT